MPSLLHRRYGSLLIRLASAPSYTHSVSAEGIAVIPLCEECRKLWLPEDQERWEAHWIDDGPEEKLVFYCPHCAALEFGASDRA
jgi:hypothetical protein